MDSTQKRMFGYSEYWRKNKSAVESQEFIKVLFALRKVGRYIASNVKTIEWSRMSAPDSKKIEIDIGLAGEEYPLPPGKMDILVGIAAREAFHCKILSDMVLLRLKKKAGRNGFREGISTDPCSQYRGRHFHQTYCKGHRMEILSSFLLAPCKTIEQAGCCPAADRLISSADLCRLCPIGQTGGKYAP
jgi:hypothetical protein